MDKLTDGRKPARPRRANSFAAEAAFRARLAELGATLLEPEWLGNGEKYRTRCANGHECFPRPNNVAKGVGICAVCAKRDTRAAEAAFRQLLAEIGATPLFDRWEGVQRGYPVRCLNGHLCNPWPSQLRDGRGICLACVGHSSAASEAKFRARVRVLGGEPTYNKWLGADKGHRVRCALGHEGFPHPNSVNGGGGICRTCAGQNPAVVEQEFRRRIIELGGVPLFDVWLGNHTAHRARCPRGHECQPIPTVLQRGGGMCRTCVGQDPAAAEAWFKAKLAELGAVPLYSEWKGTGHPHLVRCSAGHECWPRPGGLRGGKGVCRTCGGRDSKASEAEFRERLASVGAAAMFDQWLGASSPHWVRCSAGHDCQPRPDNVKTGQGICARCSSGASTVFYVLGHAEKPVVKFGISSLDGRGRLSKHRSRGFSTIHRLVTGLAEGTPWQVENAVKSALFLAGQKPVQGKEYFDSCTLALILDVADSWLEDDAAA